MTKAFLHAGYVYLLVNNSHIGFHARENLALNPSKLQLLHSWLQMAYIALDQTDKVPAAELDQQGAIVAVASLLKAAGVTDEQLG